MFSCKFCKISKTPFLTEHPGGCFSLVLITLQEHILQNIFSPNISFWMVVLLSTISFFFFFFVMNWIVSLSIFLISLAAVYRGSAIKLFLRITQISLKNNCAGVFFYRFEGLKSPAAILWRNRHHRRCFSVNFAKCTYKADPRDWFCTLLQVDFKFISHFSATIIVFEIFYQTQ